MTRRRVRFSRNRSAGFVQNVLGDHDFVEQELELKANTRTTAEVERLVREVKQLVEKHDVS